MDRYPARSDGEGARRDALLEEQLVVERDRTRRVLDAKYDLEERQGRERNEQIERIHHLQNRVNMLESRAFAPENHHREARLLEERDLLRRRLMDAMADDRRDGRPREDAQRMQQNYSTELQVMRDRLDGAVREAARLKVERDQLYAVGRVGREDAMRIERSRAALEEQIRRFEAERDNFERQAYNDQNYEELVRCRGELRELADAMAVATREREMFARQFKEEYDARNKLERADRYGPARRVQGDMIKRLQEFEIVLHNLKQENRDIERSKDVEIVALKQQLNAAHNDAETILTQLQEERAGRTAAPREIAYQSAQPIYETERLTDRLPRPPQGYQYVEADLPLEPSTTRTQLSSAPARASASPQPGYLLWQGVSPPAPFYPGAVQPAFNGLVHGGAGGAMYAPPPARYAPPPAFAPMYQHSPPAPGLGYGQYRG